MKLLVLFLLHLTVKSNAANAPQYTQIVMKILEAYIGEIVASAGEETECGKQLQVYVDDVKRFELWALQMLDSSAKLQPGILTGNLIQIGNYDECLKIDTSRNGSQIRGQYCKTTVSPSQTVNECVNRNFEERGIIGLGKTTLDEIKTYLNLYWDVCVPAACSAEDLQSIWNFAEERYELKIHLLFNDSLCTTIQKINHYSLVQIAAIITFAIIGIIVLSSTLYDVLIFQKQKGEKYNLFMAFSYYTNGKRLFSIKDNEEGKITCLDGIRAISIVWIILGHRFLINFVGTAINFAYNSEWFQHEENMFIMGAFACVDTFFVISGFLIVYLTMIAKENEIEVNFIVFYIHRILRLTPALAALILVYVGILPHLGSGPYWHFVDIILIQRCVSKWWSTLTFVQNYLHPTQTCMIQSWYLSVDTHLYVLSPLIFLPLQRWPKPTIALTLGLILVSSGFAVHATYYYKIDSASLGVAINYFKYIYNPTHIRMGPWLVGILMGYYMFQTRNKNIEIKKKYVYLLWVLCLGSMLLVIYCCIAFLKYKFTILMAAIFNGFSRLVWAVCICWIIFACSRGYGGYINKFLSLNIFKVLSRLTFSMYLTHAFVQGVVQGQKGTNAYIHNLFHFYEVWGDFAFTVALSVIWTLTFESPVSILESVLIKRALKKNKESKEIYTSKRL